MACVEMQQIREKSKATKQGPKQASAAPAIEFINGLA
jgi:hypothetical protein